MDRDYQKDGKIFNFFVAEGKKDKDINDKKMEEYLNKLPNEKLANEFIINVSKELGDDSADFLIYCERKFGLINDEVVKQAADMFEMDVLEKTSILEHIEKHPYLLNFMLPAVENSESVRIKLQQVVNTIQSNYLIDSLFKEPDDLKTARDYITRENLTRFDSLLYVPTENKDNSDFKEGGRAYNIIYHIDRSLKEFVDLLLAFVDRKKAVVELLDSVGLIDGEDYGMLTKDLVKEYFDELSPKMYSADVVDYIKRHPELYDYIIPILYHNTRIPNYTSLILGLKPNKDEEKKMSSQTRDQIKKMYSSPVFISGPVSCTEYYRETDTDGKASPMRIYVFGDHHSRRTRCDAKAVPIQDFLKRTFEENKDKIIDFYGEFDYVSTDDKYVFISETSIGDVRKMLLKCSYRTDVSECEFKNVRVHYADIRRLENLDKGLINKKAHDQLFNRTEKLDKKHIYDTYTGEFKKDFIDKKIDKQINNVKQPDKNIIKGYYTPLLNSYFELFKLYIQDYSPKEDSIYYAPNRRFKDMAMDMFSFNMDYYLISRVFRDYTTKSKKGEFKESKAKNVIIYVGDWHAQNYESVLTRLNFKIINKVFNTYHNCFDSDMNYQFQCIDLKHFMPFFP